ncbi:MAG: response regulator [Elusimicrobia bacterium]|nr:response regulator [Elusimicrobiota bacterium]
MSITNENREFTTFQAARICGVFHTTVINWVNKGKLAAHHTPGGHRRILLANLVAFMKHYDMPIPEGIVDERKRVLVVEDDPVVQQVLVRALKPLPELEITTCVNGMEALLAIGKRAPDLVVLDIRIPHVNGLELCRLLRNNDYTDPVKIIAVSGEALSAADEYFLRTHADCYFRKPLQIDIFQEAAMDLLELEEISQKQEVRP